VLDAAEHGAEIHNHTRAIGFLREGPRVRGVRVRDELTGTERDLHARLVLNCAGPWLDEVEQLADPQGELMLRRTKGVHLVVPPFTRHALILESEDRSRVVFAIPWNGHTLLGTTDTDHQGDNDGVHAEPDDVDYLLREVRSVLDVDLKRDDVRFTTAGLRPLQRLLGRSTAAVTRRERLIDHGDRPGLLTLVGGKITTYRNIAQVVVDEVQRKLGYAPARCLTAKLPLPGGRLETHWPGFVHDVLRESARHNVPPDVGQHLADHYGAEAFGLLEAVHHRPELGRRIAAEGPWIWAEVDHAVTMEMARTLSDVMLRRLSLGFSADQGRGVAPAVARFLADRLGWDAARQDAEVAAYEATLARSWAAPTP
jgi:glycerol-3-phosphate dehydrogenase